MMGFYRSVAGSVEVSILSADVAGCLQSLESAQISAYGVGSEDPVTLVLTIRRKDLQDLQRLCERKGYVLQIKKKRGLFWPIRAACKRPVLLIGIALLLTAATMLPGRILFITTDGNEAVPSRLILEYAEDCGLNFGAKRRDIRSEQVKNALLESIPKLQWVGVNTFGCRAVITVRERAEEISEGYSGGVCHITAAQDGVIRSCTVTRGSGLCRVGQAVKRGDVLVSGYTDCGLTITAERAEGEILAQTKRSVNVVTPANYRIQSQVTGCDRRFSLLIGKKRINFYKGSGISGATCDKMYSKYVLTLPGGFQLPVALIKETVAACVLSEIAADDPQLLLAESAAEYLKAQMTDGRILRRSECIEEDIGVLRLTGVYDCLENIGIVQDEMIGEFNGKTDGTDRERRPGG